MEDLISVIIPAYNCEKYIGDCLDSIFNQTYKNIEIIVINDGSTDGTINILKEFEKKDSRINLIDKENTGVSNTRNLGIKVAKGKYFTFIDSDDWIEKDFIEELHKSIIKNQAEIVRCNYMLVENDKKIKRKVRNIDYKKYEGDSVNEVISEFLISNTGNENYVMLFMIKNDKEKIFFDENLIYMEDLIYYFDLIASRKSIYFLDKELYNYRSNASSVTHSATKNIELLRQVLVVREILFKRLDENRENIENINYIKEVFNGKCLKIISVRLGRMIRSGMTYKNYKEIFYEIYNQSEDLLKKYDIHEQNLIEKMQLRFFKNKKVISLFLLNKLKTLI